MARHAMTCPELRFAFHTSMVGLVYSLGYNFFYRNTLASFRSAVTEYAADMNLLLTYYKCKDDWQDEHKIPTV